MSRNYTILSIQFFFLSNGAVMLLNSLRIDPKECPYKVLEILAITRSHPVHCGNHMSTKKTLSFFR